MTLDNLLNPSHLLESVNVLGVVPQQLSLPLHGMDELVAGGRLELARVNLTGKLEERPGILPEVVDVEHGLWVWQVRKVLGKPSIHPVLGPEVRNTTGDGDASTSQDDDIGTALDQLHTVFQGVHGAQL